MSKAWSIDPSINRVGWAKVEGIYQDDRGRWDATEAQWTWGYWDIHGCFLTTKLKNIADEITLAGGIDPDDNDQLIVEWPKYFDAERGQIAAKKGHTINLAAIDAYLAGYFRMPAEQWHPTFPDDWKGNLSKEITRHRFFKLLGVKRPLKVDHNAVDAAMMLYWWCRKHKVMDRIVVASSVLDSDETEDS